MTKVAENPETGLAVQDTQLTEVVIKSGIELTKAEAYAVAFSPYMQKVNEITEKAKTINYENPSVSDAALARKLRLELVPNRTGSEKKKDELKKELLTEGSLIQSLHNVVKSTSEMTETKLMEVEKFQERKEAEAKAKLKSEREIELSAYVENASMFPLGEMSEDAYQQLLNGQKLAHEARVEAERKAEEQKAENERKEKLLRARHLKLAPFAQFIEMAQLTIGTTDNEWEEMLTIAEAKKAEHEAEQKRIREENERLKKEAEQREAERKEIEQKLAVERRALQEQADKEMAEAELKLKEQREVAEKLQRELQQKKEAEEKVEAERLAAIEAEAAKGDKEKFDDLIKELESISGKYSFKSKKYKTAFASISDLINKTINYAISKQ